jgi:hypothetical protein
MTGPAREPDGKENPPTGKNFAVDFCTYVTTVPALWGNHTQARPLAPVESPGTGQARRHR